MADNPEVARFLSALEELCRKHGLSISHEDRHGNFLVVPFDDELVEWLKEAVDHTGEPRG